MQRLQNVSSFYMNFINMAINFGMSETKKIIRTNDVTFNKNML